MDESDNHTNRKAKWSAARMIAAAVGVAVAALAFLRGDYLLGGGYGVTCLFVSLGLTWLFVRSFPVAGRASRFRLVALGIVSLVIGYALAHPGVINHDMQELMDMQALDRAARAELNRVFRSDPAFAHLSITSEQVKGVRVRVSGSLAHRVDFDRLRHRITTECPTISNCALQWRILLRAGGTSIDEIDRDLFPSDEVDDRRRKAA